MNGVEIKKDIYWVGVKDWNLVEFHGYATPHGSTYNSYLIMDDKITLVDGVKHYMSDEMIARVKSLTDFSKIEYVIVNHVEMDHSGNIPVVMKLAPQAKETVAKVWPEATLGEYTGSQKDMTQTVIFATVQSISKDLEKFSPTDFDYLIVDECHHAAANTYQKIFTYFHPKFILGLTATPERSDGEDMLELFQNVAHKMDLKTAVERGILVPIRCVRNKTNNKQTDVRINGIKYNSQDLESKLFIPERNQLIVDTYLKYVNGKKTVIFCASVDHAAEIAKYQPMAYVLAPENKRKLDQDMLIQGEKPEAWLDVPIDVSDYEIIDLFNWQNSVKDMISQIEFVRMVDVQSETVERYIKDGKVKPDLSTPFGDKRMFHYFREESIRNIAKQYGWDLITPQNMADKFMKFIETMDMSYSYKPVLLKAI